jgi:hypothetical protein
VIANTTTSCGFDTEFELKIKCVLGVRCRESINEFLGKQKSKDERGKKRHYSSPVAMIASYWRPRFLPRFSFLSIAS